VHLRKRNDYGKRQKISYENNGMMLLLEKNGRKNHEKIFYVLQDYDYLDMLFINERKSYGIGLFETMKRKKMILKKQKQNQRRKRSQKNHFGIQQQDKC
jgi:hypothetical protein